MSKEEPKTEEKTSPKEARGETKIFKPSPSPETKPITGHALFGKTTPDEHKSRSEGSGITGHHLLGLHKLPTAKALSMEEKKKGA